MLPHHLLMDDSALGEGAQGDRSRGHGRQKAPFWSANQELSRRHRIEEEARRPRQVQILGARLSLVASRLSTLAEDEQHHII